MKHSGHAIFYFGLSLCAVLNCEFITTIRANTLLGPGQGNMVYAVYSVLVSVGVLAFYLLMKHARRRQRIKAMVAVTACVAAVALIALTFTTNVRVFWAALILLYLAVGVNTGFVSYLLFSIYRHRQPAGKILALASLVGFSVHYIVSLAFSAAVFNAAAVMLATLPAIVALPLLSSGPHSRLTGETKLAPAPNGDARRVAVMLAITGAAVAILSFLVGVADTLVVQRMPFHFGSGFFFYPILFHAPGQILACLLVDVRQGKYVSTAALVAAILLIPTTLLLESPEEFYIHSVFSYFIGGFFMVYIMTGFISIAHKAKNPLLAICLSGMLYPVMCGVGGLLSPQISFSMDSYMVLTGYSVLIVFLALATWMSQARTGASRTVTVVTGTPATLHAELDQRDIAGQYRLTGRENEILPYLLSSMTSEEISAELHISTSTLKTHTRNILRKTDASSRRELRKQLL